MGDPAESETRCTVIYLCTAGIDVHGSQVDGRCKQTSHLQLIKGSGRIVRISYELYGSLFKPPVLPIGE